MKIEVISYVKKKIILEFEKCQWEDGVGKAFKENNLTEMEKSVSRMEDALEEAEKFIKETGNLLASIKEE